MSGHVNYYDILEIQKGSPQEEITKAYKRLAKKWHPDRNPDNTEEATEKFKMISEANTVLSDPQKKEIYDKHGYEGLQQSGGGDFSGIDPRAMFEQVFGGMGGMGGLGGMMGQMFGMQQDDENGGVEDKQVPVKMTLADAYNGKTVKVKFNRVSLCDKCDGTGAKDKTSSVECKKCDGSGRMIVRIQQGPMQQMAQVPCKDCKGSGVNSSVDLCKKCTGNKGCEGEIELDVIIPKGVFHQYPVIVENEGHAIPKNKVVGTRTRSNLICVVVDAQSDDVFKRGPVIKEKGGAKPEDLMIEVNLTFAESLAGVYKEIKHMDGHMVKILLNDPVRHGDTYAIKNEGMPKFGKEGKFGDLIVQINVDHPNLSNIDPKVRSKIVELLNGTPPKLSKKTVPNELIDMETYRKDALMKLQAEKMRQQFQHQKKHHHSHNCDDADCNEDSDSDDGSAGFGAGFGGGHGGAQQVQCPQS